MESNPSEIEPTKSSLIINPQIQKLELSNFIAKYPVTQRFANLYNTIHQRGLINENSMCYQTTQKNVLSEAQVWMSSNRAEDIVEQTVLRLPQRSSTHCNQPTYSSICKNSVYGKVEHLPTILQKRNRIKVQQKHLVYNTKGLMKSQSLWRLKTQEQNQDTITSCNNIYNDEFQLTASCSPQAEDGLFLTKTNLRLTELNEKSPERQLLVLQEENFKHFQQFQKNKQQIQQMLVKLKFQAHTSKNAEFNKYTQKMFRASNSQQKFELMQNK